MNELVPDLVAVGRLLGAAILLCAPGAALCWWLYPGRALGLLERVYLSMVASLCLLTLIGVGLLEIEGRLNPRALAYWCAACTATCVVMRVGATILAREEAPRRPAGGRQPPHGPQQSTAETGREREAVLVRGVRDAIPARSGPHCYPAGRHEVNLATRKAARSPGGRQGYTDPSPKNRRDLKALLARWWCWALPRGALLGIVALTLIAYRLHAICRASDPRSAAGNGPLVAFSIPVDRLPEVQAALQTTGAHGGSAAIPFCVENLGRKEGVYRVEAWASGRVGEVPGLYVSAGAHHCRELDLQLARGTTAPLDLYLYSVQDTVPLAQLRVWMGE